MKLILKIVKWLGLMFLAIFIVGNMFIIFSGRTYLYKGIRNTYLKGRSGPSVNDNSIFSNRSVKAGNYQPWLIARDYNKKKIPADIMDTLLKYQTIAFLIIKDDSIEYESYWDGFDQDSHTNSFSMAKSILGVLTGIARREGKIKSLDDPIVNYIPDFKGDPQKKITIRHLLMMSSGINFDEDYLNPLAYPAEGYYGSDLANLTYRTRYKSKDKPGKIFNYLSGDSQLLAFILEKATGMHIADFASEYLWKKIRAKNDAWWNLDREGGNEKAFCCFNAGAPDFARIGKLIMNFGNWNGEQILDSNYVFEMTTPRGLTEVNGKKCEKYGYQWWLIPDVKGRRIFYMRGILGQYVICIPDEKMIVVRLGQKRPPNMDKMDYPSDVLTYIDCALRMYAPLQKK